MIDGIDGSGKSTVISAWKKFLSDQGNATFDLKDYFQTNNRYPELHELKSYDFIFSAEPTFTGIGKVIREELISQKKHYSAEAIAQAYALDRLILYTKIIIPLLQDGKCVVQDRGVSTSLAYQTIQNSNLTLETVSELAGNKLALTNRPDHLVLLKVKPEIAIQRLSGRLEKQDNVIFEKLDFLKKISRQYETKEFTNIFENRGTKIHYLSGEEKIDIMNEQAIDLLKKILK
jgi:dTMP kinase